MATCGPVGRSVEDPVSVPVSFVITDVMEHSHALPFLTVLYFSVDEEKKCMLLVMRVLSIVPLNFKVRLHINLFFSFRLDGTLRRFHDRNRTTTPANVHVFSFFL